MQHELPSKRGSRGLVYVDVEEVVNGTLARMFRRGTRYHRA